MEGAMRKFFTILCLISTLTFNLLAGTTGKIAGKITDATTGEALPSVNIMVHGTQLGAITDINGNYVILNVPPGVYTVSVSMISYRKQDLKDIRVNVDFTTRLDIKLESGSVDLPPVVVQGERNPLIRQDLTNPQVAITSENIQELPITSISEVLKLQAGVVTDNDGAIHIRGGRSNEIAYSVNGISINNPFDNSQGVGIATNAVQEVSLSSGTFSAEYGNALSGVVNYVTKEGSEKLSGSLRAYTGDYLSTHKDVFFNIDDIDPFNRVRTEGTLGGIIPYTNKKLSFFSSGVYAKSKGYLYGIKLYGTKDGYKIPNEFSSTDSRYGSSSSPYVFDPSGDGVASGDGSIVPMNTSESYNATGKLTYKFSSTFKVDYDFLIDHSKWQNYERAYRYNPDGRLTYYSENMTNSIGITHSVLENVFYTLKIAYSNTDDHSYAFENPQDPGYAPSNYARYIPQTDILTGGTNLARSYQKTKTLDIKFDGVAQLFETHEVKAGFEGRFYKLNRTYYELLYDTTTVYNTVPVVPTPDVQASNTTYVNYERKPVQFSAYILDKIELAKSLILNIGLRYEYFHSKAKYSTNLNADLSNQTGSYANTYLEDSKPKQSISPRISVSYPITDKGIIRFSYGHFYQNPSLLQLYQNPNFLAPGSSDPTFGNPNLEPERSIQYEMGLQQQLSDNLKFDFTGFYKDVTNLLEYETFRTAKGDREYSVISNINYANVKGITFSLMKRKELGGLFSFTLDYTFSLATGNRTDEDAFFYDQATGKQTEKYFVTLPFDRTHVVNGSISFSQTDDWSASAIFSMLTGTPYTPSVPTDSYANSYLQYSARRPFQWNVDLKLEKFFKTFGISYSVFLQVSNLFDTENEIYVYTNSGRSLYNADAKKNDSNFDDLRTRITRGDSGMFPMSTIDDYYKRADYLSAPRQVSFGLSIIF
jgi:outer membrane receptor protein involved in Fe transport